MPPYLNVCGQDEQKSKFWAKNIVFCPKIVFLVAQKFLKVVRPFRLIECFQTSYILALVKYPQ